MIILDAILNYPQFMSFEPLDDPSFRQIVWAHFDEHPVARKQPDIVDPHPSGNVRQHGMSVIQLYFESGARQVLFDHPFQLNYFFIV